MTQFHVESEVLRRYRGGADEVDKDLCCPTTYDPHYLKIIPEEILERDYGCGDPSQWVREGETALDLGSGGGKICYILAQKVGRDGRVIGVDFNDTMLSLARKHQPAIESALGYSNISFRKGRIQDLCLDLESPEADVPLIPTESVDVVVSNCVLNLVSAEQKPRLFSEIHRVLRRGGRAVISDIVCDEEPNEKIKNDPKLWSGCIGGALTEEGFLQAFAAAGMYGIAILERGNVWRVVDGIEFRSLTVRAYKGKEGRCLERNQAVIYRGPWKSVTDDDGHTYFRGARMAVCDKTFRIMTDPAGPYAGAIEAVEPRIETPVDDATAFDCCRSVARHPRETKGADYSATTDEAKCC